MFSVSLMPADYEDVISHYTQPAEVVGDKLGEHDFFQGTAPGICGVERSPGLRSGGFPANRSSKKTRPSATAGPQ